MSRRRAWLAVLLGAAMASGVGACGGQSGGDPTASCTDEVRTAGEPGDAEMLLVFGSAGYSPTIVYADGAVVIPTAAAAEIGASGAAGFLHLPMMLPGYQGEQPGGFTAGWLSDCELATVIEHADDLFQPGVDFGDPQVTDHTSTPFRYGDETISIYAFTRHDPAQWGDLSSAQGRARQALADLWTLVETSAELTGELEIDRLFVRTYSPIADDDVTDWPLEMPISEVSANGCATVSDPAQIEALLDRLDDAPMLEESPWRLAIVAAAPGVSDCEG